METHTARIYAILARDKPVGVVFRRGPSKQVMLAKWNLREDTFECGQWFKGRIYERRCDLSPNGKLLIYFASKQKPPLFTWTAISQPPYFTALALWPKGDCWNGGGWFVDDKRVRLNHGPPETALHPHFRSGNIEVVGLAETRGEDRTVWDILRQRDGWQRTEIGNAVEQKRPRKGWRYDPAEQWDKPHPKNADFRLRMEIIGVANRQSPWYRIRYSVCEGSEERSNLGLCDWADWDHHHGDLVYAKGGSLFRQRLEGKRLLPAARLVEMNELKFNEVVAPPAAKQWPK